MGIAGLIQRLISASVVEKQQDRLAFTFGFDSYLAWHAEHKKVRAGSLEDWAEMLRGYSYSLGSLSSEEVAAFIVLLQYSSEPTEKSPIL